MKIALQVVDGLLCLATGAVAAVVDRVKPAMTEDQIVGTSSALKYVLERLPIGDHEYPVFLEYETLIYTVASRYACLSSKAGFAECHRYAARFVLDLAQLRLTFKESIRDFAFFKHAQDEIDRQIRSLTRPVNVPPGKELWEILFPSEAEEVLRRRAARERAEVIRRLTLPGTAGAQAGRGDRFRGYFDRKPCQNAAANIFAARN